MALVYSDTKLSDIVVNDPSVIPVLNRLNITLGLGDKNVATICEEKKLDKDFFITILNTFMNEEYFPEKILKSFSATKIINYLMGTNSYYKQFQIPNIERHFNSLITRSESGNNNLQYLYKFFIKTKQELLDRIETDTTTLFPTIIALEQKIKENNDSISEKYIDFDNEASDAIEEKLSDLKNMFVIHLSGDYDINLCHAVLFAIISLEKDIKQNNRIRNRILIPLFTAMNKTAIK